MRPIILAMALLALPAAADYSIYVDGKKVADCVAPAAEQQPAPAYTPAPGDNTMGTMLFGRTAKDNGSPINPELVYDQLMLAPGLAFFEMLDGGTTIHHMLWYVDGTLDRRENYYPYTTKLDLAPGQHLITVEVYATETQLLATYGVSVFVGDGGAAVDPAASGREVVVEWTEPTSRENGEPLKIGDLAEYILEVNSDTIKIPAPSSRHTLWLPSGTYLIAISVVDTDGLRSEKSVPIEITL